MTIEKNTAVKIRLFTYKSFRHYGGREITATPHVCKAIFLYPQSDYTNVVELMEDCAGYKKGHKIAVLPINFNV